MDDFATVIDKYSTKAEFYFQKPVDSGNFIEIKNEDEDL